MPLRNVKLLGVPCFEGEGGEFLRLERRGAALLAFLGLEGGCSKYALATSLWPDSPPATVRNNMRQLLRRMRLLLGGEELVEGDAERLQLRPEVQLDAVQMKAAARTRQHAAVLALPAGPLLEGLGFDDCPEFARWLDGARVQVEGWRQRARQGELQRLEALGDWPGTLALLESWVRAEPESEEAGQALMRALYGRGERHAALAAYARLKRALARELGVTPDAETAALARRIEADSTRAPPPAPSTPLEPGLPNTLQRPPVLAGRAQAWAELEEAWQAGQLIVVAGEPGVGKSRLVEEFLASKGGYISLGGRVGDGDVPYASRARALRRLLQENPALKLPEWVRRELIRILPELARRGETPTPLSTQEEKLRFYDAQSTAMRMLCQGYAAVLIDDVQYCDAASAEVAIYHWAHALPLGQPGGMARVVACYRVGELPQALASLPARLVDSQLARLILLKGLASEDVRVLLRGLGVPELEAHAERLASYTQGNPLFLVETVKHLLQAGALREGWPERLPPPGRVRLLIQKRLERLSPLALRLAQLAAIAQSHFCAALAATALRIPEEAVQEALQELHVALVLTDERFTHDLLFEAVLAFMPEAVQRELHGRLAEAFEASAKPAALCAHHWLEARRSERALPLLLRAAEESEQVLRLGEAAELYARAAQLLAQAGQQEESVRVRERAAQCRERSGAQAR